MLNVCAEGQCLTWCHTIAHKWLYSKGWLHRDISAGNILLAMNPEDPDQAPGFLIDLEYARTSSNDTVVTETQVPQTQIRGLSGQIYTKSGGKIVHKRFNGPPRGAPITVSPHPRFDNPFRSDQQYTGDIALLIASPAVSSAQSRFGTRAYSWRRCGVLLPRPHLCGDTFTRVLRANAICQVP